MKCTTCGKEEGHPLELYDGSWACQHCRGKIGLPELCFTAENRELYAMSELYYSEWLTKDAEAQKKDGAKSIEIAVKLCRMAAEKGNPNAIIRLGYFFDKDYVEINYTETMRCKIAFNYYSYICFYEQALKTDRERGENLSEIKIEIQKRAAKLMLDMLANAPKELTVQPKYDFETNKRKIISKGILRENEIVISANNDYVTEISGSETVMKFLTSCLSVYRAPLFGILRLTGKEFKQIINDRKNGQRFIKMAMSGVDIYYALCDDNGCVALSENFIKLSGENFIRNKIDDLEPDNYYRLVCFNNRGKHRFFTSRGRNKMFKYLINDLQGEPLRQIIDKNRDSDCVFFDDDIYVYKKKSSLIGAVEKLIESTRQVEE